MFNMPKGPFCQSCGMPLESELLFGTKLDGSKTQEYCTYCYQNGSFTAPDISLKEMLEKSTNILIEKRGMSAMQAKMLTNMFIPKLKRWN
jgi:hypothetical protein